MPVERASAAAGERGRRGAAPPRCAAPGSYPHALARGDGWFGHSEVFVVLAALSFVAARFLPLLAIPYTCPLKALLGIPCAACGMTHAFVHLAHGQVAAAVSASPAGALAACGAWAFSLAGVARLALRRPWPTLPPRLARALAAAGLVTVLANWAFLVVAHRS